jgi:hypothetical protein
LAAYKARMQSLFLLPALALLLGTGQTPSDWPGRPKGDPPRLHQAGPPPAWVETRAHSTWLAYGSYCWTTLCVDMIPPAKRKDIPALSVGPGATVRIHLSFVPHAANVVILRGAHPITLRLRPRRILVWRPRARGLALLDVRGARGSAGYLVRLRLPSGS